MNEIFSTEFLVQGIPGLQAAQGGAGAQQQNVVMVQPSQNLTSMTSSPVQAASNACRCHKIVHEIYRMEFC